MGVKKLIMYVLKLYCTFFPNYLYRHFNMDFSIQSYFFFFRHFICISSFNFFKCFYYLLICDTYLLYCNIKMTDKKCLYPSNNLAFKIKENVIRTNTSCKPLKINFWQYKNIKLGKYSE